MRETNCAARHSCDGHVSHLSRLPEHVIADLNEKTREWSLQSIAAFIENQFGGGGEPIEPSRA